MKRKLFIGLLIVVLVIAILWWLQYKQEKEFMDSLQLHQPIAINQVESIHIWEKGTEERQVATKDYLHVVERFNEYEPNRISEKKNPPSLAQVLVEMKEGTVIINYVDGKIFVSRTDINPEGIEYVFPDGAPELESFFME